METAPTTQLLQPEIRELLSAGRFADLRGALGGLDSVETADLLLALEVEEAAVAFRFLPRDAAAEVFSHLDAENQGRLIAAIGDSAAGRLVEDMSPDDRAALLDELPSEITTRLINELSPESRRVTQLILGYPEESVGRLMTPDYVRVRPEWTVQKSMRHIRHWGRDAETVHWIFVIDTAGRLIDDIHIRTLLLADPEATIQDLMDDRFVALGATDDQEEAVRAFARYDRTALPVVNDAGALLGIVTVDDVVDVAAEEVTEDIQKQAGMEALERPYLQASLWEMIRARGSVLSILIVVQSLTIGVLGAFERQLDTAVYLVLFIPLIIACGGNTGTQAASLLVRSLA
ncbi:MAG: magnesium transporter, partial [Planctomycetota bacterium]